MAGMKIALLTDGVAPYVLGGMQRHAAMLSHQLARQGADVVLFHTVNDEGSAQAARVLEGFPEDVLALLKNIFVAAPRRRSFPGHYLWEAFNYSQLLLSRYQREQINADFIYAQGLSGWAFVTAPSSVRQRLPPIAINAHGYEMFQKTADWRSYMENVVYRPVFKKLTRRADLTFSFPGRIRDIVTQSIGVPPDRIIEMANAVDESWFVSQTQNRTGDIRFLFVGRHERRKGVPELIAALARLAPGGWQAHFVGPLPEPTQLRGPHIHYHGAVRDTLALQRHFDNADFLVCPSYAEGMPTVILEAMARGLAIIATDVGATRTVVNPDNGFLLPSADVGQILAALQSALSLSSTDLFAIKKASSAESVG
jgi:glycosyltransferase involved in cell wall biosynthesis